MKVVKTIELMGVVFAIALGNGHASGLFGQTEPSTNTEPSPLESFGIGETNASLVVARVQDGLAEIGISWSSGFNDPLEVFSATDLRAMDWRLSYPDIITDGTNGCSWTDPIAIDSNRFYCVANADLDRDADGLSDAREVLLHGTDASNADTDGDGLLDGEDNSPRLAGPIISIIQPAEGSLITSESINVSGEIAFDGILQSVTVNALPATWFTNASGTYFTVELHVAADGPYPIHITARGEREGEVLAGALQCAIIADLYPPELTVLSASTGDIITSRYVHVTVQSDDTATVTIKGVEAVQDGFLNMAWIELEPGTNSVVIESTDAAGRPSVQTLSLICDVPSGFVEEPPADADWDGVPDALDYAPLNAAVQDAVSITSPVNGRSFQIQGDPSAFEIGRTIQLEGQAYGCSSVKVHVRGLHGPWGADSFYIVPVDASESYSQEIKLFPGPNRITVNTGSRSCTRRINLTVIPPDLRVVFDYSPRGLMYNCGTMYVFREGYMRADDHAKLYMDQALYRDVYPTNEEQYDVMDDLQYLEVQNAMPGIYDVSIRHYCHPSYEGPPASGILTVSVFVNGQLSDRCQQTLSLWGGSPAVVVYPESTMLSIGIHSGEYPGAFAVDTSGGRDVCAAGAILGDGFRVYIHDTVSLSGSNGQDPVYVCTGETAEINNTSLIEDIFFMLLPEYLWPPKVSVRVLDAAGIQDGPSTNAFIDEAGCFTALDRGHYQVAALDTRWPYNNPDPLDVYVIDPPKLVPDYDRDGIIEAEDEALAASGEPFRFWINDDDDDPSSEVSGNDIPSSAFADCDNSNIDGMRDLVDFFPVRITLDALVCDASDFSYHLIQEGAGLNFAYTEFPTDDVSQYLEDIATARSLADADTYAVFPSYGAPPYDGTELNDPGFLDRIAVNHQAVLLMEGNANTTAPLILEVRSRTSGETICSCAMNLGISGVEDMFRHYNLRSIAGGTERVPSRLDAPNLPDQVTQDHGLLFIHGYNVDEDSARSFHAETFKRMWLSGFNGRYAGLSWFGHPDDLGNLFSPEYHQAIVNAFATAGAAAQAIETFKASVGGPVDVIAHSAGNVVVGSAVQDHGCTFRNYIALDAATPTEAYGFDDAFSFGGDYARVTYVDESMLSQARFDEGLFSVVGYPWTEYDSRLHASEWYRRFEGTGDARQFLTWRNRFAGVGSGNPEGYNFYSSTEEVLRNFTGDGLVHGSFWDWLQWVGDYVPGVDADLEAGENFTKLYAWVKQEKTKGRRDEWLPHISVGGLPDTCTGWGFSQEGQFINELLWIVDLGPKSPESVQAEITGPNAAEFWESIKTDPLFRKRPAVLFDADAGSLLPQDCTTIPWLQDTTALCSFRDWLLASAFPATTYAMGANVNNVWPITRNMDMSGPDFMTDTIMWPRYCRDPFTSSQDREEWHHSDYKDIAYTHVYKLYQRWLEIIGEGE